MDFYQINFSFFTLHVFENCSTYQIFIDNSITGSKESKNMGNEVLFLVLQSFPVTKILGEINLLSSPEWGFSLLVHLPDVMVLDWEDYKASGIVLQQGFNFLGLSGCFLNWLKQVQHSLVKGQTHYTRHKEIWIFLIGPWKKLSYLVCFFYNILWNRKKNLKLYHITSN